MRKVLLTSVVAFVLTLHAGCVQPVEGNTAGKAKASEGISNGIVYLTKSSFVESIFDYEKESEWRYKGDLPAIIDFYADWCAPCRMLAPVLDELQKEYAGKLQIYKVDTQKERQLSGALGIQSLPTVLFIPKEGKPQALLGFRSKEDLEKIISDFLNVKK
ncbi:MAG: thioredoxin [Breznakibacter sp.]